MSALSDVRKIAEGDLTPAAALLSVRTALKSTEVATGHIYAAFRDLVWKKLVGREFGNELGDWHSTLAQTEALLRQDQQPSVADRLSVLGELLAQSARYAQLHPHEEVLQRKHVREILKLLDQDDNKMPRSAIAKALGLADANLSRVLGIMVMAGLVKRQRDGKQAIYVLEAAGSEALRQSARRPTGPVMVAPAAAVANPAAQQFAASEFTET